MTEKNLSHELLLRLGNVQLLVSWTGEGVHRRPVTKIGKILPEEVLKIHPEASNEWSMEELAALETLTREAKKVMLNRQSIDIAATRVHEEPVETDSAQDVPPKKVVKKRAWKKGSKR